MDTGDDTFPEVRPEPPAEYVYRPHYCQYFYATLTTQAERNLGAIAQVFLHCCYLRDT